MGAHTALASWRKGLRLSQSDVVEKLRALGAGVARPTYSFWEKDRRPGYEHAVAIEALSGGGIRVEAWGYSAGAALELARLRGVAARAEQRRTKAAAKPERGAA